ncbi:MAG TPA: response regulator transcription factor [Puia sp.]|nr:response regulator transcription factor [Puia sp.]
MIRVFIVDDHPVVVEGIRSLLIREKNVDWAGHALTASDCSAWFRDHTADVILMDIHLPDKSGIDLCAEIKSGQPAVHILALSTLNQPSYIHKMIENGADGYLLKNASREELLEAIETVAMGGEYLCMEALEVMKKRNDNEGERTLLTRREKEILTLIANGLTNPEIAEQLFVSPWTVDSHRKSIMTKLNAKNTALLIKYAYEQGLL